MFCYNPISYCWYDQLCFISYFCFPLNTTVVPTSEVILRSQRGMYYCYVYHSHIFLPVFILLTEPSSCVPGAINYNKEDLTIMLSFTQDNDHQISDVLLSIWGRDKVDRRGENGNKERWYCGFCVNEYNICNSKKALIHLTRSGVHIIS